MRLFGQLFDAGIEGDRVAGAHQAVKRRLGDLGQDHLSRQSCLASPTRMPDVWAMPSRIRLCGTIGNAGIEIVQVLFGQRDVLNRRARSLGVNSTNLSIQIQRIEGSGFRFQWQHGRR